MILGLIALWFVAIWYFTVPARHTMQFDPGPLEVIRPPRLNGVEVYRMYPNGASVSTPTDGYILYPSNAFTCGGSSYNQTLPTTAACTMGPISSSWSTNTIRTNHE